jgi:hypothetical protein
LLETSEIVKVALDISADAEIWLQRPWSFSFTRAA